MTYNLTEDEVQKFLELNKTYLENKNYKVYLLVQNLNMIMLIELYNQMN